jgi:hypothetical protein
MAKGIIKKTLFTGLALTFLCALNSQLSTARAQGTAFIYQGQLGDGGSPANGTYDVQFTLYATITTGSAIAGPVTNSATAVSNGLFTATIDFGPGAFTGSSDWLDIAVRTNGAATFTELTPRQPITPTPYAIYSANAGSALTANTANSATTATTAGSSETATTATTANTVAAGSVTGTSIASNSITAGNIASSTIMAGNIADGQVVKSFNGLEDSVNLSAGANAALLANGNNLQLSAVVPNVEFFLSNGTFVVPSNVTRIKVEMWGGGGGSGKGYQGNQGIEYSGGGGGAGGYDLGVFTVTPGSSFPVTVGSGGKTNQTGGTSSFGGLMSTTGGSGGANGTTGPEALGGAGGNSSGGLLAGAFPGGSGANGDSPVTGGGLGGSVWRGGVSSYGMKGQASGPGAGANGGNGDGAFAGTNGNGGAVIVYY